MLANTQSTQRESRREGPEVASTDTKLVADVLLYEWWDVGEVSNHAEILPASTPTAA